MISDMSIIALTTADDKPIRPGFVETLPNNSEFQCEQRNVLDGWRGTSRAPYYAAKGLDPARCARAARYQLGTHALCAQHAGGLLLDLALAMSIEGTRA